MEELEFKEKLFDQVQKSYPTIFGFLMFLGLIQFAYGVSIDSVGYFFFGLSFIGFAVSVCIPMLAQNMKALTISLIGTVIILVQFSIWLYGIEPWGGTSDFILVSIFFPIGLAFLWSGVIIDCTTQDHRLKYYMFPILPLFLIALSVIFYANNYGTIDWEHFNWTLFKSMALIILIGAIIIDHFEVHSIISLKKFYKKKERRDDIAFFGLMTLGLTGLLINPFIFVLFGYFVRLNINDMALYLYLSTIFGTIALIGGMLKSERDARMFFCKMIGLLVISLSIIIILIMYGRPVEFGRL